MTFEVNNCCYCADLRTGSLIIGYLRLVFDIILTLIIIFSFKELINDVLGKDANDDQTLIAMLLSFLAFILLLNLLFDIILVIGIHKNKRKLVKAYIVFTSAMLFLSIMTFLSNLSKAPTVTGSINFIISAGLQLYFLLVIRSHYLKMEEIVNEPAIFKS